MISTKKMQSLKKGDLLYYYDSFNDRIIEVTMPTDEIFGTYTYIKDINDYRYYFLVKMTHVVDKKGHKLMTLDQSVNVYNSDLYETAMEAYNAKAKLEKEQYNKYIAEINSLEDIFMFPIINSFGESNDNIPAIRAYKDKIKEIVGIELKY